MINLHDVFVSFSSGTRALRGVSLSVKNGEFVFIVGPSGAGKTTLLRLLTAEQRPTEGKVQIGDFDLSQLHPREVPYLRRAVGVVYQDFRLIEKKTVYENIALAMHVTNTRSDVIRKRVSFLLDIVGLAYKDRRLPSELSGGEQQRVAIARALANNPDLIIADEPTGNLDPERSYDTMKLFERINAMGTTVLIITHAQDLVNRFSKRVITLDRGRVVGDRKGGYYEGEDAPLPEPDHSDISQPQREYTPDDEDLGVDIEIDTDVGRTATLNDGKDADGTARSADDPTLDIPDFIDGENRQTDASADELAARIIDSILREMEMGGDEDGQH